MVRLVKNFLVYWQLVVTYNAMSIKPAIINCNIFKADDEKILVIENTASTRNLFLEAINDRHRRYPIHNHKSDYGNFANSFLITNCFGRVTIPVLVQDNFLVKRKLTNEVL
ncbi:MAG TPA: hypothetical protein VE944_10090 [Nostoc sp.]|uniref:hypothetical protein n=1 Tax=Nostoc sp. TaxID=1180 RepID=UPI002D668121|nr:hypothetical protein [Nostoc sp.]HYX14700.1 hypothetical protein [Nostoc sp.]